MSKLAAVVLIVIAIWVGLTVYAEGVDDAFGGLFARFGDSATLEPAANRSTPDRARDAFQRAYNKSEERVERALGDRR